MIAQGLKGFFSAISIDGTHPRDPALARLLGFGSRTVSGADVTPEKALGLPAYFRAVNLLANPVAKLPMIVNRLTIEGEIPDKDHAAYPLLKRKANDEMTADTFKKTLQAHALNWGNGVAWIRRDGAGRPVELIPLLPDRTSLVRLRNGVPDRNVQSAGQLMYFSRIAGELRSFLPENILHIMGLSFNGLWGYPIVELLKESLGEAIAVRTFGATFFGQGAVPSGVVTMPTGMDDEEDKENFLVELNKKHAGLGSQHRVLLLEENAKWTSTTIPPEAAQFLQTREMNVRDIANIVGVQPHKLGDPSRKSYNSLEQSNQEQKEDNIDPWLCVWEKEAEDKLLTEDEKRNETHEIKFNRDSLEFVSMKDKTDSVIKLHNNSFIDKDEGRKRIGLPPSGDPNAKRFKMARNIGFEDQQDQPPSARRTDQTAGQATSTQGSAALNRHDPARASGQTNCQAGQAAASIDSAEASTNQASVIAGDQAAGQAAGIDPPTGIFSSDPTEVLRHLAIDSFSRIVKRITTQAIKHAKASAIAGPRAGAEFMDWLDSMIESNRSQCRSILESASKVCSLSRSQPIDTAAAANEVLDQLFNQFNELANKTTPKKLVEAVEGLAAELVETMPASQAEEFTK